MDLYDIITQAISIIAMTTYIISYSLKQKKTIIFFQCIATVFFAISFAMLGAIMGCILNVISAIRAVLFLYKDKLKTDNKIWLVGFLTLYAVIYVLVFTVFGKEFSLTNAIIELLPIIGMVATTFGFRAKTTTGVRIGGLINEPVWFVYNIISHSSGAILSNIFSIFSICFGLIRDKKGKNNQTKNLS